MGKTLNTIFSCSKIHLRPGFFFETRNKNRFCLFVCFSIITFLRGYGGDGSAGAGAVFLWTTSLALSWFEAELLLANNPECARN